MATTAKRRPPAATKDDTPPAPDALVGAVNINEATKRLGISRSSVYELISAGDLVMAKVAGRSVVTLGSIQKAIRRGVEQYEAEVAERVHKAQARVGAPKAKAARS